MKRKKRKVAPTESFWSARMGLGEWTTDDKREVDKAANELLAARLKCSVKEAEERRKLAAKVAV